MKRTGRVLLGLLIVSACAMAAAPNKAAMNMYQDALYQEQTAGDLDKAIELYQKVVADAGEIERLAAKATFQLGMCYLKKDDKTKAAEYFQKVVSTYPAQKELVANAQKQLEQIAPQPKGSSEKKTVLNDSFEQGTVVPDGWTKGDDVEGVEYIWDKAVAGDGKASLCLKKTAQKYFPIAQWTRQIEYSGGVSVVEVKCQVKADKVFKAIVDVVFQDQDGAWIRHDWISYIGNKNNVNASVTHDWKMYAGKAKIPANTASIVIGLQIYGPGTVWFDQLDVAYSGSAGPAIRTVSPEEMSKIVKNAVETISTCTETDPKVKDATDTLAGLDCGLAVGEICKYLDSDTDTIRRSAIYILWRGGLSDISAAEAKLIMLCSHKENLTRGMAGLAMASIKTPAVLDALKIMAEDPDGYTRRCGVYALGLYGDPAAIPLVEKALKDQDPLVKGNAQAAMTMLKNSESQNASPEKIQSLINEMHDPDAPRFVALNKLIKIGTPAVEPLIEELQQSNDWQVAKALGAIKNKSAVGPLIDKWAAGNVSPMKEVITEALGLITEQTFGEDLQKWQQWWKDNKESYTPENQAAENK